MVQAYPLWYNLSGNEDETPWVDPPRQQKERLDVYH